MGSESRGCSFHLLCAHLSCKFVKFGNGRSSTIPNCLCFWCCLFMARLGRQPMLLYMIKRKFVRCSAFVHLWLPFFFPLPPGSFFGLNFFDHSKKSKSAASVAFFAKSLKASGTGFWTNRTAGRFHYPRPASLDVCYQYQEALTPASLGGTYKYSVWLPLNFHR